MALKTNLFWIFFLPQVTWKRLIALTLNSQLIFIKIAFPLDFWTCSGGLAIPHCQGSRRPRQQHKLRSGCQRLDWKCQPSPGSSSQLESGCCLDKRSQHVWRSRRIRRISTQRVRPGWRERGKVRDTQKKKGSRVEWWYNLSWQSTYLHSTLVLSGNHS